MARVFNAGGGGGGSAAFKLDHITIVTPPQRKEYKSGEPFDPEGLTISATYSNGATLSVSGFDWNPKTLTDGVEYVTISYTEGRTTVTVRQDVTVIPVLKSIRVSKDPDKKDYVYLETFDPEGMEVMAVMSDDSEHKAEGFQTAKPTFQTIGEQQVEITYEEDGVTVKTTYTVDVQRVSLPVPSQTGVLTYNKSPQSPSWNNYEPGKMSVEGNTQTDAGTYEATFTLSYGYQWEGGSTEPEKVDWEIKRAVITETPSPKSSITADGEDHEPEWNNYDPEKLTIDGDTSGSEPNTYTVTFTPTKNYEWDDGTQDPREVTWEIVDATVLVTVPKQSGTLTYTGDSQTPNWADFDRTNTDISGDTEGTDAKTYTATFTLHDGCAWVTGGNEAKQIQWTIDRATIPAVPKQSGTLTYTGGVQEPAWDTYDKSKMTISGDTDGTDAKTYTAHFTPTDNYQWDGGDTDARDATWTIEKASVTLPEQNGTLTYNTSQQEPSWTGNEPGKFTVGGETSGTDAGSYTAEFTPTDNYQWADGGGNEMRESTWTIGKATGTLTAQPTEVSLGPDHLEETVQLEKTGDGAITVENDAPDICEAEVAGDSVVVRAKNKEKPAKKIGDIPVGETITLNENGSPVKFLVVQQGRPDPSIYDASCGGTWLLREELHSNRVWDGTSSSYNNKYEESDIDAWLNGTYLQSLDANIQAAIIQAKIPYRKDGGSGGTDQTGASGLPRKIFLLSGQEVGFTTATNQYFPVDGARLSYFLAGDDTNARNKRIAKLNNSATRWWLRSPNTGSTSSAWLVNSDGSYYLNDTYRTYGIRPALILPSDFEIEQGTAEYTSGTAHLTVKMTDGQNYTGAEASVTVNAAFTQVFGVVWDMSNSSTALQRLTVENDPRKLVTTNIEGTPEAAVGTTGGSSPFDAFMPWKGMEEYNIMDNGAIIKNGEQTFSRTQNDTVVYIPEFGYKAVEDGDKIYYYISSAPTEACPKHPGSGKYVGKYATGEGCFSKSGLAPQVNMTRAVARTKSAEKGDGWQQWGYDTWCAIVALYIVEWADWNSQKKVGRGYVDSNSSALKNGQTDTMSYHTGRVSGTDGKTQIMYRWIEGLWGNVRQWVDGYNANDTTTYFCLDPTKYEDGTNTDYTALGVNLPSSGWTKALGVSTAADWAYCPKTNGGSDSTYIPDQVYSSSGWRVLLVGGRWDHGSNAGLCCFDASNSVTYSNSSIGSRLLYNPL